MGGGVCGSALNQYGIHPWKMQDAIHSVQCSPTLRQDWNTAPQKPSRQQALHGTHRYWATFMTQSQFLEHACCQPAGQCAADHLVCERSYDTSIVLLAITSLQIWVISFAAGLKSRSLPFSNTKQIIQMRDATHVSKYIKYIPDSPAYIWSASTHGFLEVFWTGK